MGNYLTIEQIVELKKFLSFSNSLPIALGVNANGLTAIQKLPEYQPVLQIDIQLKDKDSVPVYLMQEQFQDCIQFDDESWFKIWRSSHKGDLVGMIVPRSL